MKSRDWAGVRAAGRRLYESPRAVNMVDGLPRAPSRAEKVVKKIETSRTKSKISQNLNWELDTGAIFTPSLGPKVSRNVFRVSVYAFWKDPSWSTVFL